MRIDNPVLWIVVIFRLIIAIFSQTTFVPDEYYQVVEPAFKASFLIGFTTWEWFFNHQIRSFLALLPVIWLYEAIIYFTIDYIEVIALVPRVLQSLLTAYSDVHLFIICETVVNVQFAWCATIIHCLSWSSAYLMSRALANSTEASLIIIGVSFLLQLQQSDNRKSSESYTHFLSCSAVIIASISAYSRPTCLFFWIPLFLFQFSVLKRPLRFLVHYCIPIAVSIIEFAVSIDSFYYGSFAFTPLNFYMDNITHNYAALFGVNSWHWNFTNGLPVILGLYTPLLVYTVLYTKLPPFIFRLLYTSLFYVVMLTVMSPHQEYRFLLPCLPWIHLCIAYTIYDVFYGSTSCTQSVYSGDAFTVKETRHMHTGLQSTRRTFWKYILSTIAVFHMVAVFYLIRYHQSGAEVALIKIAKHVRATSHQSTSVGNNKHIVPVHSPPPSIILAAPCYAFPGYAYVYTTRYPVRMYMHECSPGNASSFDTDILGNVQQLVDVALTGSGDTMKETTQLNAVAENQQSKEGIHSTPQHQYLVTFDAYLPALQSLINLNHFEQLYVVQHALFRYDYDDPFSKKAVHVFYRINGNISNDN